eukprot:TRINITY_DN5202_c0_g1_i1.p1 TRINITY_DN5202_c0_g1~~TRINITY_DN5202_c0_g1_i1.p1  ORF type:complete len:202 (-),score=40.47 TRINITY_DN5202_c0_g1_i1:48-653(-)
MNIFVYLVFLSILITGMCALQGNILTLRAGTNITVRVQTVANGQPVSPKVAFIAQYMCDDPDEARIITCTDNCTITKDLCVPSLTYPFFQVDFPNKVLYPLTDYTFPSWCSIDLYAYFTYLNNQSIGIGKPTPRDLAVVATCIEDPSYELLFLGSVSSSGSPFPCPPSWGIIMAVVGLTIILVTGTMPSSSSSQLAKKRYT